MSIGLGTTLGVSEPAILWLIGGVGVVVVIAAIAVSRRRPRLSQRSRSTADQGDGGCCAGWWFFGAGSDRSPEASGPDPATTPVESATGWGSGYDGGDSGGGDGGGGDGGGGD